MLFSDIHLRILELSIIIPRDCHFLESVIQAWQQGKGEGTSTRKLSKRDLLNKRDLQMLTHRDKAEITQPWPDTHAWHSNPCHTWGFVNFLDTKIGAKKQGST